MIDQNDPRLTAFVLGELDDDEKVEISRAVDESEELADVVAQIRRTTVQLTDEFLTDACVGLSPEQKGTLVSTTGEQDPSSSNSAKVFAMKHWGWLVVAASVVALAGPFLRTQFGFDHLQLAARRAPVSVASDPNEFDQLAIEQSDGEAIERITPEALATLVLEDGQRSDEGIETKGFGLAVADQDVAVIRSGNRPALNDEWSGKAGAEQHFSVATPQLQRDGYEPMGVYPSTQTWGELDLHRSRRRVLHDGLEASITQRGMLGTTAEMEQIEKLEGADVAGRAREVEQARRTVSQVERLSIPAGGEETLAELAGDVADRKATRLGQITKPLTEGKQATTWKRVKAVPNASRLMVGDAVELEMNGMQVHVQVDGFRARVLVDYFYYNDHQQQLEGKFKVRLPDDASLYYFAFGQSAFDLTSNGELPARGFVSKTAPKTKFVSLEADAIRRDRRDLWRNVKEARMVTREKAAFAYGQTVRRRVDPALVEWAGAGVFNASVFPLMPRKLHRVVVGYDVDLTRTARGFVYDLDLPEQAGRCSVEIDVREVADENIVLDTAAEAKRTVSEQGTHFGIDQPKPGQSIRLHVETRESVVLHSLHDDADRFFAARMKLDLPILEQRGSSRGVFLVDTSLSSRPDKFNVWLDLLRATLDNNRDSLKHFAVLFFNVENHFWRERFVENTPENVRRLIIDCQQLALEGATDLYAATNRLASTKWISGTPADVFLLSDGDVNWGEADLRLVQKSLSDAELSSVFAYQTGLSGTAVSSLRFLANESGGAVFSVTSKDEVAKASTAHRSRPWRLKSVSADGATDLMTAGRVQWVYSGQSLTVVGRLHANDAAGLLTRSIEDSSEPAAIARRPRNSGPTNLEFVLARGNEERTVSLRSPILIETDIANRLYGQVAVGQLEDLGDSVFDVSSAYARHFRITGKTCSLLMLESEQDYQRFNIMPEEDLFVVRTKNASDLVSAVIKDQAAVLGDPKTQLSEWLSRLESMDGLEFKLPTALKLALQDIQIEPIAELLNTRSNLVEDLTKEYSRHLEEEQLNYEIVQKESDRRGNTSSADAIKVLSSLVERNPGDWVLARDVAFSAMEMSRPAQAYHLLRRIALARPYDPSVYVAIGQCLTQLNKADMAIVFYEVALNGEFRNRAGDFRRIAGAEYAFLLRDVVAGRKASNIRPYARARLESLYEKLGVKQSADLLITMAWNTDQTDVDLHVIEPSGEECFYSHPRTRSGGQLTRDITDGFGPEMYVIENAPKGEYDLWVKYFSTNPNRLGMRSKVYLTIYREFGSGTESVVRKVVSIKKPGEKERVERIVLK